MKNYVEKRKFERYNICLPLYIYDKSENDQLYECSTINISANGALLSFKLSLKTGTKVQIGIKMDLNVLKELKNSIKIVEISGEVIRAEENGLAVYFERDFAIKNY